MLKEGDMTKRLSILTVVATVLLSSPLISAWIAVPSMLMSEQRSTRSRSRLLEAVVSTPDLQAELDAEGLGLCHGILHASGVRCLDDIKGFLPDQITNMGVDNFDRREMDRVIAKLILKNSTRSNGSRRFDNKDNEEKKEEEKPVVLCTVISDDVFDNNISIRENNEKQDFGIIVVNKDHNIFKGRLFTEEQCEQIIRMAEYAAYGSIGTIGDGWGNEIYTLTAQHMPCKNIPDFLPQTRHIFNNLLQEMYAIFPERICQDSVCYESDNEPHLVKYSGKAKGTELHTDNSKQLCITVNVVLSAKSDFDGGGTYITALNETIHLERGEMLIHLGDLEHAGTEISSGVRHILIAFLACKWNDKYISYE